MYFKIVATMPINAFNFYIFLQNILFTICTISYITQVYLQRDYVDFNYIQILFKSLLVQNGSSWSRTNFAIYFEVQLYDELYFPFSPDSSNKNCCWLRYYKTWLKCESVFMKMLHVASDNVFARLTRGCYLRLCPTITN